MRGKMDLQKMIDAMCEMDRQTRSQYQLTLGTAISKLGDVDGSTPVVFDIGGGPHHAHSYRGYYSDLAFDTADTGVYVKDFLGYLRESNGETFMGYKGGDYTMEDNTPLWVASYGDCGRAMMDIVLTDGKAVITTKEID